MTIQVVCKVKESKARRIMNTTRLLPFVLFGVVVDEKILATKKSRQGHSVQKGIGGKD